MSDDTDEGRRPLQQNIKVETTDNAVSLCYASSIKFILSVDANNWSNPLKIIHQ